MDLILKVFLEQGILGAVAALAIGWAIYKERECRKLYEALVAKTEAINERYHKALMRMSETVSALTSYNSHDHEDDGEE